MFKKIFLLIIAVVVIAVVAAGVFAWYVLTQPLNPSQTTTQHFVIAPGQSITTIGNRLTEAGLIRHPLVFRFWVWKEQRTSQIQAGSFSLAPNMTPQHIVETLTKGTDDVWIKVLEGWRVEEIADALDGLKDPTFPERKALTQFHGKEFLMLAKKDEGMLFPDSYLVPKSATAEQIHQLLTNTFEQKVTQGLAEDFAAVSASTSTTMGTSTDTVTHTSPRTPQEILIMASLVQRESARDEEMKTVAGILWNRIDAGMKLDVDATLQYLSGYNFQYSKWWVPPDAAAKASTSLYNTYTHAGLPPGPICNPGLAAIKAALSPVKTDYVYYMHDLEGQVHYAKTLEEHNRNVQRYLR